MVASHDPDIGPDVERQLLEQFFPQGKSRDGRSALVAEACIVVDSEGIILLWYLPGSLQEARQDLLCRAIENLARRKNTPIQKQTHTNPPHHFYDSEDNIVPPGEAMFYMFDGTKEASHSFAKLHRAI
ncbi:hypothetical protein CC1G_07420 [Coprinopsis cinerea okayama7|uniref:Uncharacterized protein n=1 Tax=Coprinopsis cinerea (strain Okayama-7 / 130 / ATCC MYA-4618 / FGSC 9003) TaxID=240176 RepID=A8N6P9_COPC7|nr:hypothetical protein CC1G_07420 [Coprinopsis cinerea okayama7\|eukprot:XP_001830505.2 hypothetical protein CC1G_07420 [Coprinopsis cinerea okayama7\